MAKKKYTSILTATSPDTTYGSCDSDWLDCVTSTYVRLLFTIVKDDATTFELKLEVEASGGSTGFESWKISSGAASLDEIAVTAADLSSTHRLALNVDVPSVQRLRVRCKKTGGSGSPTIAIAAVEGEL